MRPMRNLVGTDPAERAQGPPQQPQRPVSAGAWLRRWSEVQEATDYVASGRANLVEGGGWRVARGPGIDITITLRGVDLPRT
jgi:hypothetical protein